MSNDAEDPTAITHAGREDSRPIEGELIEPGPPPATTRPPGRRPVAPFHVVPALTDADVEILTADPGELLRRRVAHYLRWADSFVSTSPSKINRVSFGAESQRRMIADLLKLSISPARTAGDQFDDMRRTPDSELLAILESLGPDPALSLRQAAETETGEGQS
jgi:hypothetical protein